MNDPNDLYRQTRAAQSNAERGGFINTATALNAVAEMLLQEAQVDAAVIAEFAHRAGPPGGALPVFRQARL